MPWQWEVILWGLCTWIILCYCNGVVLVGSCIGIIICWCNLIGILYCWDNHVSPIELHVNIWWPSAEPVKPQNSHSASDSESNMTDPEWVLIGFGIGILLGSACTAYICCKLCRCTSISIPIPTRAPTQEQDSEQQWSESERNMNAVRFTIDTGLLPHIQPLIRVHQPENLPFSRSFNITKQTLMQLYRTNIVNLNFRTAEDTILHPSDTPLSVGLRYGEIISVTFTVCMWNSGMFRPCEPVTVIENTKTTK